MPSIPTCWIYTKLINVCLFIKRGKTPVYSPKQEIPVIAQKCNQKDGFLSLEKALFIEPDSIRRYSQNQFLKTNDILINSTGGGTVGRTTIAKEDIFSKYKIIVTDSHITTVRVCETISSDYIYCFLKSPSIFDNVEDRCEGTTNQIELYPRVIMNYVVPLPPYFEQIRIVRKITRLFVEINGLFCS